MKVAKFVVVRFEKFITFICFQFFQAVKKAIYDEIIAEGKKEQLKSFEQVRVSL